MNKQELIEQIKCLKNIFGNKTKYVEKDTVIKLISELDEPQKVKIPQFVAEWIEKSRLKGWDLLSSMCFTLNDKDKKTIKWLHLGENVNIFAHAWLDGYEVEKEKRYQARVKGIAGYGSYLNKGLLSGEYFFASNSEVSEYRTKFTRKELEDAGFGWVFDCEGVEVEEVTE